jgi:demethylmenaquinone methyltransferase/2-methoxy-6-polyprenyl-1,4-benzoquinol methylase
MRKALNMQKLKGVYDLAAKRYDVQHALLTARSDQRGRKLLVEKTVAPGDIVLDCGAGTGSTALLAAQRIGPAGKVMLFDLCDGMLNVAKDRAVAAGVLERLEFQTGDMLDLPFADNSFDAVLSTYSICPLHDPARGAMELYRVVKPGGHIGIAHSAEPQKPLVKWLADKFESVIWRIPSISLGCRPVSVLPALKQAGGNIIFEKRIGVPLWPFVVFVIEKPASS